MAARLALASIFWCAMACMAAGGAVSTSNASPATAEQVLDRAEAAEAAIRDVRLKFTQVTRLKATAEEQETVGELVVLKSPERFKVTFMSPVRQIAYYDGSRLVLYYPETRQAFRQKAALADLSRLIGVNPASPAGTFRRGYRASLAGCDGTGCRIVFSRTTAAGAVDAAGEAAWKVRVSATTWLMEDASFENSEIRISLKCRDYLINRGLNAESIRLALPKGVEIVEGIPQISGQEWAR